MSVQAQSVEECSQVQYQSNNVLYLIVHHGSNPMAVLERKSMLRIVYIKRQHNKEYHLAADIELTSIETEMLSLPDTFSNSS